MRKERTYTINGTKVTVTNVGKKFVSYATENGTKCKVSFKWFKENAR